MLYKRFIILMIVMVLLSVTGTATIKISGYFIANDSCPAFQSFNKGTNPGNIMVTTDMAYEVIGQNAANASHYLIIVKGANPEQRWVSVSCGKLLINCNVTSPKTSPQTQPVPQEEGQPTPQTVLPEYLLAVSWQPAFCETHTSKPECGEEEPTAYEATHFTLHGLWPQPESNIYCGVSSQIKTQDKQSQWCQMPSINLSETTMSALITVMPGVASCLQNHEWYKHGICYGDPADTYFCEAIQLLYQLNDSAVQKFFAENIGKTVSSQDILKKFDEAFGPGASTKIQVKCTGHDGKSLVTELYINLKGIIEADTDLKTLLQNAAKANKITCSTVYIDEIGIDN